MHTLMITVSIVAEFYSCTGFTYASHRLIACIIWWWHRFFCLFAISIDVLAEWTFNNGQNIVSVKVILSAIELIQLNVKQNFEQFTCKGQDYQMYICNLFANFILFANCILNSGVRIETSAFQNWWFKFALFCF